MKKPVTLPHSIQILRRQPELVETGWGSARQVYRTYYLVTMTDSGIQSRHKSAKAAQEWAQSQSCAESDQGRGRD